MGLVGSDESNSTERTTYGISRHRPFFGRLVSLIAQNSTRTGPGGKSNAPDIRQYDSFPGTFGYGTCRSQMQGLGRFPVDRC